MFLRFHHDSWKKYRKLIEIVELSTFHFAVTFQSRIKQLVNRITLINTSRTIYLTQQIISSKALNSNRAPLRLTKYPFLFFSFSFFASFLVITEIVFNEHKLEILSTEMRARCSKIRQEKFRETILIACCFSTIGTIILKRCRALILYQRDYQ